MIVEVDENDRVLTVRGRREEVVETDAPRAETEVEAKTQAEAETPGDGAEVTKPVYHRRERHFGSFKNVYALPSDVVASRITAAMTEGVLTVTAPRLPKEQAEAARQGPDSKASPRNGKRFAAERPVSRVSSGRARTRSDDTRARRRSKALRRGARAGSRCPGSSERGPRRETFAPRRTTREKKERAARHAHARRRRRTFTNGIAQHKEETKYHAVIVV